MGNHLFNIPGTLWIPARGERGFFWWFRLKSVNPIGKPKGNDAFRRAKRAGDFCGIVEERAGFLGVLTEKVAKTIGKP